MKKGISLAALTATITIMIILISTVVISGNNMSNNTKKSNFLKEINSIQESVNTYLDNNYNDYPILNNVVIDLSNVSDENKEQFIQNGEEIINNTLSLYEIDYEKIKYTNIKYGNKKDGDNDVYVLSTVTGNVYYAKGFKVGNEVIYCSTVNANNYSVNAYKSKTINGNKPTYNNPIIPVGFIPVETSDATWEDKNNDGYPDGWNDGLVISDDVGNEFVWVPVDGINVTYTKNFSYSSYYGATSDNTLDVSVNELPKGVNENTQILNYGGFYIGRYEAGKASGATDILGKPTSKEGVAAWINIDYNNSNDRAQELYNNSNVKSGLMTGTMWDTTCEWINNEKDENNNILHSVADSRSWGNHINSISPADVSGYGSVQPTGYCEYWKAKNIYDFAGNVWEWTYDAYKSYRVYRGGRCYVSGSEQPVSYRAIDAPSRGYVYLGFRIALYIM